MQNECLIEFNCNSYYGKECKFYSQNINNSNYCFYFENENRTCLNFIAKLNAFINYFKNNEELFHDMDYWPKG